MASRPTRTSPMHFKELPQAEVPQGRKGKHNATAVILSDLERLKAGVAIRVPLAALAESKEKVRSAVNRASRNAGRTVATASDDTYLYLWNAPKE